MKKLIILLFVSTLFTLNAQGQITKGYWMIGGNMSYSSITAKSELSSNNTGYTIQISPDIGYFFTDKVGVGLKSDITKQGTKATGTSVYTTYTDFNLGPFVRYYFFSEDKIINIVAEGAYLYGFEGGGSTSRRNKHPSKNTFLLIAGPVAYFNSSASLEFLIGYSSSKYVNFNGRNGTFQLSLGLQVYVKKYD